MNDIQRQILRLLISFFYFCKCFRFLNKFILIDHVLLLFKHFVFISRTKGNLSFLSLRRKIVNVYKTEQTIASTDIRKKQRFHKKWNPIKSRIEEL